MSEIPGKHAQDLELVNRVLAGDRKARRSLAARLECVPRILAAQNRRQGNPLDADEIADLAQNAIFAILRKLKTFEGRAALETWFFRFCYLELMNGLRRAARRPASLSEIEDQDDPREPWQGVATPPPPANDAEESTSIEALLRYVSPREAAVIRLRHLEQVESMGEIAEMLGIARSSARTLYYRGLEKLRRVIESRRASRRQEVGR